MTDRTKHFRGSMARRRDERQTALDAAFLFLRWVVIHAHQSDSASGVVVVVPVAVGVSDRHLEW